jgi:hypothetical protein
MNRVRRQKWFFQWITGVENRLILLGFAKTTVYILRNVYRGDHNHGRRIANSRYGQQLVEMHDLVAGVPQVLPQVMMQYRTNLPASQQANIVPVKVMRDEALRRFPQGMQDTKYRDIPTPH